MGKVLIFSDAHLRFKQIDKILSWETYDRVILLGDQWDCYSDTPDLYGDSARWVKQKLDDSRFIILLGNHDARYVWPANDYVFCSGFTRDKSAAIRAVLTQDDLLKIRLHWVEPGYNILFTHAGITPQLLMALASQGYEYPEPTNSISAIDTWLNRVWPQIQQRLDVGWGHPLVGCGYDRGGDQQQYGGATWADFSGHTPLTGIGQIIGHSVCHGGPLMRLINRNGAPMWRHFNKKGVKINPRWLKEGWTLDLDTKNRHYGILENDTLTIRSVIWTNTEKEYDWVGDIEPGEVMARIHLKEPQHE